MKKKIRFKGWFRDLIIGVNVIYVLLLSADCMDIIIFTLSKLIILSAFLFNNFLLFKYSDLFD